jgi:hypothetical protein
MFGVLYLCQDASEVSGYEMLGEIQAHSFPHPFHTSSSCKHQASVWLLMTMFLSRRGSQQEMKVTGFAVPSRVGGLEKIMYRVNWKICVLGGLS